MLLPILVIFSILVPNIFGSDDISKFAPFGPSNGDTVLFRNDDGSSTSIDFLFNFYGAPRNNLFVNNNGLITFNGSVEEYSPEGMAVIGFPAIAPFWADVDTRTDDNANSNNDTVNYRVSTNATLLAEWSSQVPDRNFHGVRMFIATWFHVKEYYYNSFNHTDSFQAILITDGTNSWVFYNYGELEWDSGEASSGIAACVGFSAGDHSNYTQTNASLTPAVVNTTNFVTLVSGSVIHIGQTCGNGIVEGSEQCDGGSCCTSNCTFVNSAVCFCQRQHIQDGQMEYYCDSTGGFYQCVGGSGASQSRQMNCGRGTHCGCTQGTECSCGQRQSPCVTAGTTQTC